MIRFYILVILFLISLLCVLKAPEYHLWLLAIGVTEFPMLFAGNNHIYAGESVSGYSVIKWQGRF